jgi:hypothetical protein
LGFLGDSVNWRCLEPSILLVENFAFNLPDSFFAYKEFKNEPRKSVSYSYDDLKCWGEELSMKIESCVVKEYESNTREVVAFNEIPVMQRNFPSEEAKEEFINDTLSKDETRKKEWVYFVFRKTS